MPLTCYCDWEPAPGEWWFHPPSDYSTLETNQAKRCSSCGRLIGRGETVARFERVKAPFSDVECRIWGEDGEIPLAPHFHCEECADIYFSLQDLGFDCVGPDEGMRELAREYAEEYGGSGDA